MGESLQGIREMIVYELERSKEKGKYICPLCGSGKGAHKTAAFSMRDSVHGHCFACGFDGDIFDLEAQKTGKSLSEATRDVIARYADNTTVEMYLKRRALASAREEFFSPTGSEEPAAAPAPVADPGPAAPADPPPAADFSAILRRYAEQLPGSPGEKYLAGRGFTPETMRRFMLGYNPDKKEITMPYNKAGSYYSTRRIDPAATVKHWKPGADTGAVPVLFNAAALRNDRPCFVVESPLCAISIMQEGGSAVALAGASNQNILLKELESIPAKPLLILSLDNDDPGREQEAKLAEKLTAAGVNFIQFNAAIDFKDPNEALQKVPDSFRAVINTAYELADTYAADLKEKAAAAYEETSTAGTFDSFLDYLRRNGERSPIPTGFSSLDKILNGGLVPGLYIMGAVSSLGKTALMVNFADNIAAAGTDVLYFSLEMSKYELMARSISRITFSLAGKNKANTDDALSTFGVLFGAKKINDPNCFLKDAMEIYRDTIGKHIWYFEGVGSIGVDDVKEAVQQHIAKTGRKPVVFIDYLQIMAAPDPRATDKHNTDVTVTTLKQLSRDQDVPVFCISSLNRMNYNEPINMAAFKESGAIEYGSDVLIGLQLYGIGYMPGENNDNKRKARIQEIVTKAEKDDQISIQVRVLKNRNGKRGDSGEFKFTKKFNTFYDVPTDFTEVYMNDNPFAEESEQQEFRL